MQRARVSEVDRTWCFRGELAWCLRGFGACVPAAALRLKVAQAAFSERALWVARAPVRGGRALQVRVVASARACAGGCARSAFGPPRQRRRRRRE